MDYLAKVKSEREDAGEVTVARGRFESALLDLLHRDEFSGDENGSEDETKEKAGSDLMDSSIFGRIGAFGSRPVRKRRRKETELKDGGGFHHTFVMRMFDRSVDLAKFPESSPLYPICRAWMMNRPHNTDVKSLGKQEIPDIFDEIEKEVSNGNDPNEVKSLPPPDPWNELDTEARVDPRIPPLLSSEETKVSRDDQNASTSQLLAENLEHWKRVREQWRTVSRQADARYHTSHAILRVMFERDCGEKAEVFNSSEEKKEIDVVGDESEL